MKKITRSIAVLVVLGFAGTTAATAQVTQQKIGDNATLISPNAALEVESTNKGLLLPRLALTATNNVAPLTAHVAGMTVYNTATVGTGTTAVTPGYYYNNGTQWVRLANQTDIPTEPWRIQNTTTDATANTDNIYQQGKVAVGFTDADGVSDKQLEVKGDMKAMYSGSGVFNIVDNNFPNTDFPGGLLSALGGSVNTMLSADNEDLGSASRINYVYTNNNSISAGLGSKTENVHTYFQAISDGSLGTAIMEAQNHPANYRSQVKANATSGQLELLAGSSLINLGGETGITLNKNYGVRFHFNDVADHTLVGHYQLPMNNGAANQVLTTPGTTPSLGTPAVLEWTDVSDIVDIPTEPWRVVTTTTEATTNTQSIYQNGNVAIGDFSTDSPIATFEVRTNGVPGTGSARIGQLSAQELNGTSPIGTNSFAVGLESRASGSNAFAAGSMSFASGINSVAMGSGTASGLSSVALGRNSLASGMNSLAMGGTLPQASGEGSIAIGSQTIATKESSIAIGRNITNSTPSSTVMGYNNAITADGMQIYNSQQMLCSRLVMVQTTTLIVPMHLPYLKTVTPP